MTSWSGIKLHNSGTSMRAVLALLCCGFCLTQCQEVRTKSGGPVRGYNETIDGDVVNIFLGIPYAAPPIDARRFKKAISPKPWFKTLDATKLPKSCPQKIDTSFEKFPGIDMWNANTQMSEDCLYLNVWAPAAAAASDRPKLAVMVWIHGGGFASGTSTLPLYDGRELALFGNVIVVSMQYRLGALGFLYTGSSEAPGNMGLTDQALALKWVQDNIDKFGGDPDKVTIFGESAGAVSVLMHLLSPESQGLFKNAIMQSGTFMSESAEKAKERAVQLGKTMGCDTSNMDSIETCLRKKSSVNLVNDFQEDNGLGCLPTVDGTFLPKDPLEMLKAGDMKKCSVIVGSNTNEGNYFLAYGFPDLFPIDAQRPITKQEFQRIIAETVPESNKILAKLVEFEYGTSYEFSHTVNYSTKADELVSDLRFVCPGQQIARLLTDAGQDVYNYHFAHRSSKNPWPEWMGVMHGYEIDIVFGQPFNETLGYTSEEENLSRTVIRYWSNFASTGDPNKSPGHHTEGGYNWMWPVHSVTNKENLFLSTKPPVVRHGRRTRQCALWEELMPEVEELLDGCGSGSGGSTRSSSVIVATLLAISAMLYHQ